MSDDEFDSSDSNGIKAVNISFKNKRKTKLSPLLNRRKTTYQNNSELGNENDAFKNLDFPSSRLSPSLGRRSPRLSPRTCSCGCIPRSDTDLTVPKCPECGQYRGFGNSAINAAWNEPLLGLNNACKLYTTEGLLKQNSNAGPRREQKGFDDLQVQDVEDTPSPIDYISIESKARLPKIVVTDMNKRSNQNVPSGTELATPVKLPPISPATPRASSPFKYSELYKTQEQDQGNEEIPE
ncbi:hypothetical protein LOTGIDRAFT_170066 [Lottia gigantea]|uniref:Uncharacterized protein n=1 Tax=Lottia gigantea TaxID=225164 RepID=V3ZJA1_LOTGI|nr:hypothetical protein LOTGIDRAFT_170066 [Lottia gigantea]ESO82435.1 hypothetical protein LOTGIDRAFT_170066 [Lottia gigantea]